MMSNTRRRGKPEEVDDARTSIDGQTATLPCKITNAAVDENGGGYVLEWHRDQRGLVYSAHSQDSLGTMAVDYQGRLKHSGLSLIFSPLRVTDAGVYWCVVKPLRGLAGSPPTGRKIQLQVHAAPTFTKVSESDVYRRFGESVTLECLAKGIPEPETTWKKDGSALQPRPGLVMANAFLTLTDLRPMDDGLYMCEASNEAGPRIHVIQLHVTGGIRFIDTPQNRTVVEGGDTQFSCIADSPPNRISYQWFFGDLKLHSAGTLALRSHFVDGTLKIQRTSKEDAGWYTCQASDGAGTSSTAKAYLDVHYKPRVLSSTPVMQFLPSGLVGRIRCDVDASPDHVSVQWHKDGVRIIYEQDGPSGKEIRYNLEEQGAVLKIEEVRAADAGEYTCQPSNSLGHGLPFEIRVFVTKAPIFDSTPTPLSERTVGQPWSVTCSAIVPAGSEEQKLEVFWRRKDGTRMPSAKIGRLVIESVTEVDHGCYDCVVRTKAIELTKEACLRVIRIVPRAPERVTVSTGAYDARLDWSPGYNGGTDTDQYFVAKYRPRQSIANNSPHWNYINASTSNGVIVTNLMPSTDYEFVIEPRNGLGTGVPSPAVIARTKGDNLEDLLIVPTDSPGGVTYFPNFGTQSFGPSPPAPRLAFHSEYPSVIFTWKQPTFQAIAGRKPVPVYYYSLEYRRAVESGEQHGRTAVGREKNFQVLADRIFDQQYRAVVNRPPFVAGKSFDVRVKAHSVASFSEPSNLVSFTVPGVPSQTALIAGIAGGVAFLFLCLVLAMLAIRCAKRRRPQRTSRVKSYRQVNGKKNNSSTNLANGRHRVDSTTDDTGGLAEWARNGRTGARQARPLSTVNPSATSPNGYRSRLSTTDDDDAGYRTGAGEFTDLSAPTNPLLTKTTRSDGNDDGAASVTMTTKPRSVLTASDSSPQMPELAEAELMMFPHSRESQV